MDSFLIGDTLNQTWVSSGATPSLITAAVFTGSESVISSESMTSSGNGHYFNSYTLPNTAGFYSSETIAWVNSFPYKRRTKFKLILDEVD